MDQEKSDFLKARLLADKKTNAVGDVSDIPGAKKTEKTVDSIAQLTSWALGLLAIYFSQIALFIKFTSIQPFNFWEILALYYALHTFLKMVLKIILAAKSK